MFGVSKNRMIRIFMYLKKDLADPYYQNIAPGLAYYFLLSMIPLFLLMGQLSGIFSLSMRYLADYIEGYLPQEIAAMILPFLTTEMTKGGLIANAIFLVTTLYLASRAMYALIKISDNAYGIPERESRFLLSASFIKQHIKAAVMTFFMLFIILFSLLIIVVGRNLIDLLLEKFQQISWFHSLDFLWNLLAPPLSLFLFFCILLLVYWAMPSRRIPVRRVLPGAVFASAGIFLSSFIYMIYVRFFWDPSLIYGTLSGIVILLLWFFIIGLVLELGILLNSAVERSRRP